MQGWCLLTSSPAPHVCHTAASPTCSEDSAQVPRSPPSRQTPSPERTPAWCGPESLKDAAGPKSWRGVGQAAEDWGELNTGKRPPAPFVLDLARREVLKVGFGGGGVRVKRVSGWGV